MIAMTMCELLWPLFSDGPIYSRVANFVTDKCTKHWWMNLLFINNYLDTVDICGGSSYYISIDIQLFAFGCFIIPLLVKNTRLAWKVCAVSCALSALHLTYKAIKYEVSACIVCSFTPLKISEYLDHVHIATTSYLPAYTVGIFVGYLMVEKKATTQLTSLTKNIFWITCASFTITYLIMLLRIFSNRQIDAFIAVSQRLITPIAWGSLLLFLHSLKKYNPFVQPELDADASSPRHSAESVDNDGNTIHSDIDKVVNEDDTFVETKQSPKIDLIKGFSRLLLPLYFTHFLVIRTMWFSQRTTFTTSIAATVSCLLVHLFACLIHFQSLSLISIREVLLPWPTVTARPSYFKFCCFHHSNQLVDGCYRSKVKATEKK